MADPINVFISREMEKPFAWSLTDCCSTADRRVLDITGISPLGLFGRPYHDAATARAWLSEPGGLPVAVNRVMRRAGFGKADVPAIDDLGLVMFGQRMAAALWTGTMWWSRDEDGFLGAPIDAAWKIWRVR